MGLTGLFRRRRQVVVEGLDIYIPARYLSDKSRAVDAVCARETAVGNAVWLTDNEVRCDIEMPTVRAGFPPWMPTTDTFPGPEFITDVIPTLGVFHQGNHSYLYRVLPETYDQKNQLWLITPITEVHVDMLSQIHRDTADGPWGTLPLMTLVENIQARHPALLVTADDAGILAHLTVGGHHDRHAIRIPFRHEWPP